MKIKLMHVRITKINKFIKFNARITKTMKNQLFHTRITKIMKFLEFQSRITKIMKIKLFHARITKLIIFLKCPRQNLENHKHVNIQYQNNENH